MHDSRPLLDGGGRGRGRRTDHEGEALTRPQRSVISPSTESRSQPRNKSSFTLIHRPHDALVGKLLGPFLPPSAPAHIVAPAGLDLLFRSTWGTWCRSTLITSSMKACSSSSSSLFFAGRCRALFGDHVLGSQKCLFLPSGSVFGKDFRLLYSCRV